MELNPFLHIVHEFMGKLKKYFNIVRVNYDKKNQINALRKIEFVRGIFYYVWMSDFQLLQSKAVEGLDTI